MVVLVKAPGAVIKVKIPTYTWAVLNRKPIANKRFCRLHYGRDRLTLNWLFCLFSFSKFRNFWAG